MKNNNTKQNNNLKIGVDYYPEHWSEDMWEQDAELMRDAGVTIVRMAEFAWSRLEPTKGNYTFEWLDKIIDIFAKRDIEVFLCTPTSTPPQWLFEKYPEIIQVDKSGHRISIGIRGHRCLNSPVYRRLMKGVIGEMVTRYKDNPYVIGYQIDNELEANHCCCSVCKDKFREWVKAKYTTIDKVNKAYGNNVWSGEYSDFSEVNPPFGAFQQWLNPSYTLDFNRYASDSTVDYVKYQLKLIKNCDPDAVVTTNNWLCENMPDFYDMFADLDFVSYDNYPTTAIPESSEELYSHAFHLDLMRGIKRQNFWIMEQLSGLVGSWMPMAPTLRPGMLQGYALQAYAHGADAVLHFRWRSAVSGAEMFWHGIIDHSNVPGRRFEEFKKLCETVDSVKELAGSVVRNKVAILYGSDQEYAFKLQPQVEGMHYFEQLKSWHDAFTCLGIGVDIINQDSELEGYDVIVAPTMFVTNKQMVEHLYTAALSGSLVVITNRSGVKDEYNKCIMQQLPTVFSKLTGVRVMEYDPVGNKQVAMKMIDDSYEIESPVCTQWCDLIELDTARSVAVYDGEFYKGVPAITVNKYGHGEAYYIGTVLNRDTYIELARNMALTQKIEVIDKLPHGVEVTYRYKGDTAWRFVFNNTDEQQNISIIDEEIQLEPFEMNITKQIKK